MRASGVVALALLSLSVALGAVSSVLRLPDRAAGLPRFAVQAVHRDVSLLALVLLAVHAVASVFHTFVDIRWVDAVVPFTGPYEPLWIGLGTLALDLLVVAAVAAALRHRLGPRTWRVVHGTAYAAWVLAAVHAIGIGTDVDRTWAWGVAASCLLVVVAAVARRVQAGRRGGAATPVRSAGPGGPSWSP
ncbi:MAG: ferric reductase-like transmembrane domain-containing protein [Kineosporiaceae bacterium]